MRTRLRTAGAAAGLGLVAATLAAAPASAAPPANAHTTTVEVPVTCVFEPESPSSPTMTATIRLTAPTSVAAGAAIPLAFQVDLPVLHDVPIALEDLAANSTWMVEGAPPRSIPIRWDQAPTDVPLGGGIAPEIFHRTLTAGAAGTTVTYRFMTAGYSFRITSSGVDTDARCTPDAGAVTVATTAVTEAAPATWWERFLAAWRNRFKPPAGHPVD
jgi:hypothetical protein